MTHKSLLSYSVPTRKKLPIDSIPIDKPRDKAIFMLMLRSGLRVAEVAGLTLDAIDFRRGKILVDAGKGNKGRVVHVSKDGMNALVAYLKVRPKSKAKHIFLVEKGPCRRKPLSVRGIQKRMEYYARKAGLRTSSHLRASPHATTTRLLDLCSSVVVKGKYYRSKNFERRNKP